MKPLLVAAAFVAVVLAGLTAYYRTEPTTFYGIADTKEIVISSKDPVEIRRVWVTQGQRVAEGDTLVELYNPELETQVNQVTHELSVLKTRQSAHATLSRSEIRQLKAEQQERVGELRAELKELEAQYNLNRELVSELRSLDKESKGGRAEKEENNPLLIKIENAKRMLALAQDPSKIFVDRLSDAQSLSGDPLLEQTLLLQDELNTLLDQKKKLIITSQIGGLIGSVAFKPGEKVSPFTPIITLHTGYPSFVHGYIHEDIMSEVAVGQKVVVKSNHDKHTSHESRIIGVGARIVEYPERLRKRADIMIWGREIMVALPPDNGFLLGEKVVIALAEEAPDAPSLPAKATSENDGAIDIVAPPTALAGMISISADEPGLEASGLAYLPDLDQFLVISDETKKNPRLFLMDTNGRVTQIAKIQGLDDMDDMESITQDEEGRVYLLSSQSHTKNGKLPDRRKLLARVRRQGNELRLDAKINLWDKLAEAAAAYPETDWALYLRRGMEEKTLDIEGMTYAEGSLLLGFKAPLWDGKAVILRLGGIDSLFRGKAISAGQLRLWQTLQLTAASGLACGISDLEQIGDSLFLLSTGEAREGLSHGGHQGGFWTYGIQTGKLELVRAFQDMKPEGLARHDPSGAFYLAFDNGSEKPSRILKLRANH